MKPEIYIFQTLSLRSVSHLIVLTRQRISDTNHRIIDMHTMSSSQEKNVNSFSNEIDVNVISYLCAIQWSFSSHCYKGNLYVLMLFMIRFTCTNTILRIRLNHDKDDVYR